MGPGVWENDRGGAIRVLQAFRQPKNSSTLFLNIYYYIFQGEDSSTIWAHCICCIRVAVIGV